jgi:hypothetical protein
MAVRMLVMGDAATGGSLVHQFWFPDSVAGGNTKKLIHTWGPDFSSEGRSARHLELPEEWSAPPLHINTIEDAWLHGEPGSADLITFVVTCSPGSPHNHGIESRDSIVVRSTHSARADPASWEWRWTIEKGPFGVGGAFPPTAT